MIVTLGAAVFGLSGVITRVFAQPFGVSVEFPQATSLNANMSKIDSHDSANPSDHTWTADASAMSFDPMVFDNRWKVFRCRYYYAIDVGTNGAGPWTIIHGVTGAFAGTGANGVGDHIVVTVVKQTGDRTIDAAFTKIGLDANNHAILSAINGMTFTSGELNGGWLRIYYGIYGGADPAADPRNYTATAVPITAANMPAGDTTGGISFTFTQS